MLNMNVKHVLFFLHLSNASTSRILSSIAISLANLLIYFNDSCFDKGSRITTKNFIIIIFLRYIFMLYIYVILCFK